MYLIRERFFRLGEDSDITDEHGRPVLQVDGKVLSLRNRLVVRDPEGREVAQVQRKLIAMRPTYQVLIAGQEVAEVRKHLFTPFGRHPPDHHAAASRGSCQRHQRPGRRRGPAPDRCGASSCWRMMSALRIRSRPIWPSRASAQAPQTGRLL
jgi:LURP-one-related